MKALLLGLRWIGSSGKTIWIGRTHLEQMQTKGKPWIFCFWHCNITQTLWPLRGMGFTGLVSSSHDGELAATALNAFGNQAIRGSSSSGGAKALLQLIRLLKQRKVVAITPDGPRGPARHLQIGAVALASKSGAPLLPLHMESTKQWVFQKSWDLHKIPKPFATKVICIGEPIYVPANLNKAESEKWRLQIELALNETQQKALNQVQALLQPTPT